MISIGRTKYPPLISFGTLDKTTKKTNDSSVIDINGYKVKFSILNSRNRKRMLISFSVSNGIIEKITSLQIDLHLLIIKRNEALSIISYS